jgi:hypothetical protein
VLSRIGVYCSLVFLLLSYFLVASTDLFGLDAGATGLAVKMFVHNIIMVNILLFFSIRLLNLSFNWFFFHQVRVVAVLLVVALVGKGLVSLLIQTASTFDHVLFCFISGVMYTVLAAILTYMLPVLLGLERSELKEWLGKGVGFVRQRYHS